MQQQIFRQFSGSDPRPDRLHSWNTLGQSRGPTRRSSAQRFPRCFPKTFILTIINNSPSYNCVLGCQAFEQE